MSVRPDPGPRAPRAAAVWRRARSIALALASVAWAVRAAAAPAADSARVASGSRRAVDAGGRCGTCHPAERVLFATSRHAQEEVRCTSCHGGDDRSLVVAVAHGAGFRGRPNRAVVPALCASCHADVTRMRAYNLPVDQLALYQTSGHGVRLARGDTRVAVCSDCHGAHDILAASDPASRVFFLNIARTCGRCHGDSTLMRPRGRPDVYREYLGSIHGRELLEQGNGRAPTCVSCHGVHGAAPPQVGNVDKVCGRCHTAERRYFAAGPHRDGMTRQNLPECASCHGDHATQAARPERLTTLCSTCHGEGAGASALGRRLWAEYDSARKEIEAAEALIVQADAVPLATEDYRARLGEARTYASEALPAAHSLDPEIVAGFAARARSVGVEIQREIKAKLGNLRTRKLVLVLFWFYVLVTLVVLRRFQLRGARPE
jgi:hypothetical protein